MIVFPNAKINIGLNITEKRTDGYHNIETIFYPIGIKDVLSIEPSETCEECGFSISGIPIEGDMENNLIIKAFRLLRSKYEFPPVDISLIKRIPFGAGLGGGSADAAFTLKTINTLFNLNIKTPELEELASKLGADCPFFIKNKPVYATEIGNVFSKINFSLKGYFMLLVKPDVHVSTAEAYAGVQPQKSEMKLPELIQLPVNEWKNHIKNDFESSVFQKYPKIKNVKEQMYNMGASYASMSGSGASVYGIFDKKIDYRNKFDENYFTAFGKL